MPFHVYALQHQPTAHIYIGSTKSLERRYQNWCDRIRSGAVPESFMGLSDNVKDWRWFILEESDDEYVRRVYEMENINIVRTVTPQLLLNKVMSNGNWWRMMSMKRVNAHGGAELPRKPGVFALVNAKARCGYVAYAGDLQKRAHSFAHMLAHPDTHWSIRDLPKTPPGDWTFTLIDTTADRNIADRIIRLTKKSLAARRYRVVEGSRRAQPIVLYPGTGQRLALTEAIQKAGCEENYITVWRRLDRGWTPAQALGLADPPPR